MNTAAALVVAVLLGSAAAPAAVADREGEGATKKISVTPAPQQVELLGGAAVAIKGWPVGADGPSIAPTAALIVALTTSPGAGPVAGLPASHFVALGLLPSGAKNGAFVALAGKHNITAADVPSGEGYLLQIRTDAVILAATTPVGLFHGYQTLRQLVTTASGSAPAVRIADWPSTSHRGEPQAICNTACSPRNSCDRLLAFAGAFMFGMPDFQKGVAIEDDAGVKWMTALAEYMAMHKLNTGVVTDGFWQWLETMDVEVLAKLQAIKMRFAALHINFVPSLSSGSGGQENGDTATENTAEGVWVRHAAWKFGVDDDLARPVVGLRGLGLPRNGNFSGTAVAGKGAPTGWFVSAGSFKNSSEWSLVPDSPFSGAGSAAAQAMQCEVSQPPTGGSSSYLYSDTMQITSEQMFQLSFWGKLLSPTGESLPKFEIIIPPWPAGGQPEFSLELDIGGASSDDMRLTPLPGHPLKPKWTEWTRAHLTFRAPPNATKMYMMIRLQGNSTATFSVSGIELLNLDDSMRNIIRTNTTDIRLRAGASDISKEFMIGKDFEVVAPKSTENTAHHLYIDQLEPYKVRRLPSGGIPTEAQVYASFDYLPGKVNQAGHSTPSAFGEPAYYALLENAINHTMREFKPKLLNFGED